MGRGPFAYFCPHCGAKTRTSADLRSCPGCGRSLLPEQDYFAVKKPKKAKVTKSAQKGGRHTYSYTLGYRTRDVSPVLRNLLIQHNKEHPRQYNDRELTMFASRGDRRGWAAITSEATFTGGMVWMSFETGVNERILHRVIVQESFWAMEDTIERIIQGLELTHLLHDGTIEPLTRAQAKEEWEGNVRMNRAQVVGVYAIAMEKGADATMEIINRGVSEQAFEQSVEVIATTQMGEYRYKINPDGTKSLLSKVELPEARNGSNPDDETPDS